MYTLWVAFILALKIPGSLCACAEPVAVLPAPAARLSTHVRRLPAAARTGTYINYVCAVHALCVTAVRVSQSTELGVAVLPAPAARLSAHVRRLPAAARTGTPAVWWLRRFLAAAQLFAIASLERSAAGTLRMQHDGHHRRAAMHVSSC